jgi:hypothetical protein
MAHGAWRAVARAATTSWCGSTTGEVLTRLELPEGARVSGLESDGRELLFCGGGRNGKVRAIRRPRRT